MQKLNFSAGPSVLPQSVLQQIQQDLCDYQAQGFSVLELNHRSWQFAQVMEQTEQDLRSLLQIPDNYAILFLPGSATVQFGLLAQNLLGQYTVMDYLDTGHWSQKAISQAYKYGKVNIVASNAASDRLTIPPQDTWQFSNNAAFFHYTANETIDGLAFLTVPENTPAPLVCDMSSNILTQQIPIDKFGMIYAGAQKNLGIAGISLIIIDKALLNRSDDKIIDTFNYAIQVENHSIYSTPPIFAWYVISLMLNWLKTNGGVTHFSALSEEKSRLIYDVIAEDDFYINFIDPAYRSQMNIPFNIADKNLESLFLREAEKQDMIGLKGHRARGGMRVSLYNAVPLAWARTLADFMRDFRKRHG